MVEILKEKLARYDNAEVYSGDILKFDFNSISNTYNCKLKVIGNVPYNISSPLIFHLLDSREAISGFILMLQKEVVERLAAVPGKKNYGVPSVLLQMFASVEKMFDIPSSCFYPRPKVESAVIRGTFLEKPLMELSNAVFFTKLVKASFAQRRKMLINNLKNFRLLSEIDEKRIKEILDNAGIDGRRRGETLTVEEFGNLSNLFCETNS
ncbi:MAG: Ribosomal RNA small subunit methyltransferase A [Smithella sp. PtaU1.Bin162]|nr:MAG: Ribosomal RNA small subunit methyltransferase A [Smithella sp. PtaU1.Bin162]